MALGYDHRKSSYGPLTRICGSGRWLIVIITILTANMHASAFRTRPVFVIIHPSPTNFLIGYDIHSSPRRTLHHMQAVHGTLTPLPLHTPLVTRNSIVKASSGFILNISPTFDSYLFRRALSSGSLTLTGRQWHWIATISERFQPPLECILSRLRSSSKAAKLQRKASAHSPA